MLRFYLSYDIKKLSLLSNYLEDYTSSFLTEYCVLEPSNEKQKLILKYRKRILFVADFSDGIVDGREDSRIAYARLALNARGQKKDKEYKTYISLLQEENVYIKDGKSANQILDSTRNFDESLCLDYRDEPLKKERN
jgi:hypothetical protein